MNGRKTLSESEGISSALPSVDEAPYDGCRQPFVTLKGGLDLMRNSGTELTMRTGWRGMGWGASWRTLVADIAEAWEGELMECIAHGCAELEAEFKPIGGV